MSYLTLKHLHMTCAALSLLLFIFRGQLMLRQCAGLQARWLRIVPHIIDSVLLASAIGLAFMIGQAPFVHGWLTAKVLALLVYIVLGSIALKRGKTYGVRAAAFFAALATFAYIASVAVHKNALPFLT